MTMKRSKEKGAALIFAMVLVLVLSVMAASLMFISQSETWSSLNYRLMTQARYGAEAGLHAAANYLMYNYAAPGIPGNVADPYTSYTTNVSPVTYGGSPVVLGVTMNGLSVNYPVSAVATSFGTQTAGTLTSGNNNVNYSVQAELLSMKQFRFCGSSTGQPLVGQIWKLTSHGDINAARNSEVEVSALLELHVDPCFQYAGFATGQGCGSIQFNGGGTIDSYDSGNLTLNGGAPVTQAYDGSLGSNGNLNAAPGTTVNGIFASPDTGVGSCSAGAPDALSGNTTAVTGCMTGTTNCGAPLVTLHQAQSYTNPVTDYPTCTGAGIAACDGTTATALDQTSPGNTINPGNYGDLSLAGQKTLTLNPSGTSAANCSIGIYYINSISLAGKASLTVGPCPGTGGNTGVAAVYQPVIVNIVGANGATALDIGGNGIANPGFNSSLIQFNYAGTGSINLHGNGSTSAVIYAPNASITLAGNGTIYGSVIGNTLVANGNPVSLHYDRQLANNLKVAGNWTLDTFTWSKY
jgi:Tfp pilus assembly protein PilX